MTVVEFLAQLTSIIGWILLVYSYYKDDIDQLLFVQIISSIFYCISYFLLGAYSGLLVCFIELLKGIGYYKTDNDNLIFWVTFPVYILMAFFTYDGLFSLLPIVGSIIDGFSLTKNKNIATAGSVLSNILWLIYDIVILAYASAATDALLVLSNTFLLLFGYSRLLRINKLRIVHGRGLSKNIYDAIYKLDKKTYGDDYTWSFNYEKDINNRSDDYLLMIKYHKEIVGYVSYLVLSESEYERIINSEEVIKEYDINNIIRYRKNRKNRLIIDSINIKSEYQNEVSVDLIIKKLKEVIVSKYKSDYVIDSILSVAVNKYEKEVLEKGGFSLYKSYSKNEHLYMIDNKAIEDTYLKYIRKKCDYKIIENERITTEIFNKIKVLGQENLNLVWDNDYQLPLFNENKNSLIVIMYKDKVIGYLNYLVLIKEKYDEILNSDSVIKDFTLNDITAFSKGRNNYLVFNSIVTFKKYDEYAVKLLTRRVRKRLKYMNNNYRIAGINAMAVNKNEREFLESLGFESYKKLDNGSTLYVLEKNNLRKYLK